MRALSTLLLTQSARDMTTSRIMAPTRVRPLEASRLETMITRPGLTIDPSVSTRQLLLAAVERDPEVLQYFNDEVRRDLELELELGKGHLDFLSWGWSAPEGEDAELEHFDEWFWGTGDGGLDSAIFYNDKREIILFDGLCNFCDASVAFFMANDENYSEEMNSGSFRFAAQQSTIGRSLIQQQSGVADPEDLKSIVLITEEPNGEHRLHTRSDAALRIARRLKEPYATLGKIGELVPRPIRDAVYEVVSENRKIFGEKESCRIPEDYELDRFLD